MCVDEHVFIPWLNYLQCRSTKTLVKHIDSNDVLQVDQPLALVTRSGEAKTKRRTTMNISFTPEQYKSLLMLTYLGSWMVNAHKIDPDKTFDDLAQYIYSFVQSFGIKDLVESTGDGKHYPTKEFDELAEEYLDEYDSETFWDELIDRLADR